MRRSHPLSWRLEKACALGLALASILSGCKESGVQSCLDLNAKQQYEAAVERCAEVFAREGDPKAGAAVAYAHLALGHSDEVLDWVDRLDKEGKANPGIWVFAGMVHQQRGDFEKADQAYRRDLDLYRAANRHDRIADVLDRLSLVALERDRFREAFLYAREALEEATKAQDRDLEARAADALYVVLYSVGDLEGAQRALEASYQSERQQTPAEQAGFLANRGGLLADAGRLALARRDLQKALELGKDIPDKRFFRSVHLNLTNIFLHLGEIERATHHLEEAWKHSERGGPIESSLLYYRARVDLASGHPDKAIKVAATASKQDPTPNWAWQLEYAHGRAEEALGRREAAAAAYDRSIGKLEDLRRDLAFDEMKSWLLDSKRQPFEALFLLQANAGDATAALATVERAQARTFLDAYLHASSSGDRSEDDSWSNASLERMEGLEALLPVMSESPVAAVQPIDRVLDALADRHALVYFEAGKNLWLITLAGGKVSFRALALPAAELRRLADRFLAHPEDSRAASSLGQALLPAGSLPRAGQPLVVVTDGLLVNIPFAALRPGDHYLAEDHAISFIPSLSALAALENGSSVTSAPPLILVDPLGNLPAARSEGLEVAKSLGGAPLTGGKALSKALVKASGARVLHLATHSGLGPRGAWLQLADRRISASEIVGRRIRPRLTVLASCSSGVQTGRQMWGSLGAAFLAAGSRAVLASLWPVNDRHTREFVRHFYREGGAVNPATALAQAQRVAIRQGMSPNDWAPFVLFGSNRPLNETHF